MDGTLLDDQKRLPNGFPKLLECLAKRGVAFAVASGRSYPALHIHAKKQQPGTHWRKSFAEVNLCVPDLSENEANTIRLNELERQAMKRFDDVVSSYDGTRYRYSIESIGTEADTALKCHYVNVRILFNVLNVK